MREPFTPKQIYLDVKNGKLNKLEASELLISLIEGSNEAKTRKKCLEAFEKIELKTEKVFKIIENCLVSDENSLVRSVAAKAIIRNFLKNDLSSLKWAIQHEKSPIVLKTILDLFKNIDNQKYKFLNKEIQTWIENFASIIGVVPTEAEFILDLEALFAKDGENYEIDGTTYKYYQILTDNKNSKPWLEIKDKHIVGLSLNFYNWKFIKENPEYVDYLSRLIYRDLFLSSFKNLNITRNEIREVPESISSLNSLEWLDLSRNNIQEIPESISTLISLKKLNLSRNKIREVPESIGSLSLLERLDLRRNKIRKIPESIKNLNSLIELRIDNNKIQMIPNSLKTFLNSLEHFSY